MPFRKKRRIAEPEELPPIPSAVQSALDRYKNVSDAERDGLVNQFSAWEATLPPGQQSNFRALVVAEFLTRAGFEVGAAWVAAGVEDGLAKGVSTIAASYEFLAMKLEGRPMKEVIWMIPIREHYKAIVGIRDRFIEEMRKKTSQ